VFLCKLCLKFPAFTRYFTCKGPASVQVLELSCSALGKSQVHILLSNCLIKSTEQLLWWIKILMHILRAIRIQRFIRVVRYNAEHFLHYRILYCTWCQIFHFVRYNTEHFLRYGILYTVTNFPHCEIQCRTFSAL